MRGAAVALACATILLAPATLARATPGNALGSQTGDGAGAFTGLASAPEANLFTGVAQTSIPIEVPPGRLGLAPVLALSYSSNAEASPYGTGWTLPLPRIHRSTRRGVPRYDDGDTFVLETPGAMSDLERVPGTASRYRAQIESSYARIGFDASANSWIVIDKLGVSFRFGTTASARSGRGPGRSETFAWLLERIEDPAGNRIDFTWRTGGAAGTSSGVPERIRYGANAKTGLAHFAEVVFSWEPLTHVAPVRRSWRDGYADALDVRLAAIETHTHGLPARRYDFSHEEDPVTADLRLVGVTLTAFGEGTGDDVQLPSTVFVYAPALHDGWPVYGEEVDGEPPYEIEGAGHLRLGTNRTTTDSVDLDADGLPDRIDTNRSPPRVWVGRRGGFDLVGDWNWPTSSGAPKQVRESDGAGNLLQNVFDLDGDGFADLVDSDSAACAASLGFWCVWRGGATGFASVATPWRSPIGFLRRTAGGGAKVVVDLADMDADGRLDLVDASVHDAARGILRWNVHRNTGSAFETSPRPFAAPLASLSQMSGGRMMHGLFDINADSLPDLVVADPDDPEDGVRWGQTPSWMVFFHDGSGLALEAADWPIDGGIGDGVGLPNFVSVRASDGTTIGDLFDITGDGRPDLVRRTRRLEPLFTGVSRLCTTRPDCLDHDVDDSAVSDAGCCFHLLVFVNTGSSFSQPVGWSSPAHGLRADFDACPDDGPFGCLSVLLYDFDFFDVDGDGLVDFVERFTAGQKPYTWLVHPHPASPKGGGARPNLLVAMRNGVGGETMLRYDVAAGTPETRLPFPHWVVVDRERRDSVFDQAPLRTSFAYRGGLFDAADRELRGFALVQETDPTGAIRVREYHQDRRRSGRMWRMTNLEPPRCSPADPDDPDDPCSPWRRPLGSNDYEWSASGPVLMLRETDVPFHDGAPVENLRRTAEYGYDAYGNVASRRITTPLAPATTTTTEFLHDVADGAGGLPGRYLVSKPLRAVTREDGAEAPLVERAFSYTATGSLRSSATCMSWSGADCTRWSTRSFDHDGNGNMTTARSPDGATSRTTYDANALFAVSSVDPLGLVTSATTDPRTGLVTETVAPNGNRLRSRYDGLGRLLRAWGPGTTKTSPLRRFEYAPGSLGTGPPRVVATDAASGRRASFFDGLGRLVAEKAESRDGSRDVSVVSGLRLYDERGLVAAEALPFPSDDLDVGVLRETFADAPAWLEFAHDEAGRLVETRAPDGATTRIDRSAPGILRTFDANLTGGAHPGSVTIELFDGLGRRLLRDVCSAAPFDAAPFTCPAGTLQKREHWRHDGLGRLVEQRVEGLGVAAGDAVTRIAYDGLGSRREVFHSNAGTWRYATDATGRVTDVTKPDGSRLELAYDGGGRLRKRRGPTTRAKYSYHTRGGGIGKIRRTTTRTRRSRTSESYEYDDRSRLATRRRRVSVRGARTADASVSYAYDDLDRRIATSFADWDAPEEAVVHTDYDARNRPTAVWTDTGSIVSAAWWDWQGRLVRTDYGNGVSELAGYSPADNAARDSGHLRCLRTTFTSGAGSGACAHTTADLAGLRHSAWDATGNLLRIEDALRGDSDPDGEARGFSYDALGRLAEARDARGVLVFEFDPLGNLLRNGDTTLQYADPGHPSHLTAARGADGTMRGFVYDSGGRRIADGDLAYDYDDSDRLVTVRSGDELLSESGYLDSGERAWARTFSRIEEFELGDGLRLVGGALERTVSFAGRPVCVETRAAGGRRGRDARASASSPPTERLWLHHDHQQSVRLVTDSAGTVRQRLRYSPFGERTVMPADHTPVTRIAYTGHPEDRGTGLLWLGARHYDARTGSFLTLDPAMQFASPYAYSDGNPVIGRDADGRLWQLGAMEILILATGTATFIDSIVRTGDLGHSLTAGVFAGFSVYFSAQLSTALAKPIAQTGQGWLQMTASVASDGFGAIQAVEAVEDGRYAGGIVAAGMLAASLIGIESAADAGSGTTPAEAQARHGIQDRGIIDGRRVIDVDGICATRPGCITNTLVALKENLRVLFTGKAACVGGCEHVADVVNTSLEQNDRVLLRCNSFGAVKCLGAIQEKGLQAHLGKTTESGLPALSVEMSGAPLLRPPVLSNTTYQVNLFDPVVWVGTGYSVPFSSDVSLGRNWWVPAPLVVHHTRMYEKPFHEALGEMIP